MPDSPCRANQIVVHYVDHMLGGKLALTNAFGLDQSIHADFAKDIEKLGHPGTPGP